MRTRPIRLPNRARLVASALTCILAFAGAGLPARALGGCAPPTISGGDWPMFGQNLRSDRAQPLETSLDSSNVPLLQPAWTFDAGRATHVANNEITGYPIEADGCIFVGSSTGNTTSGAHKPGWIFALNADNGDVVWQTQVQGAVYSTLAVSDGVVYAFVSRVSSPFVAALDEQTGVILWQTIVDDQLGSDAVSSPIVYEGMVWVG
ncbi:MAG: PQQ-binding-like beta-propeller repeat protein, partial [Actinomycetota bacterium]